MDRYYSNGKLLITGEYAVLDGAIALALPTKFGQDLQISELDVPCIIWESFSVEKNLWFQAEFQLAELDVATDDTKVSILKKILLEAQKLNPKFLNDGKGAFVQTFLSFPNDWGLGTSSTLINNIAQWAEVDAFELLQNSFGGSGYDIACAQNNTPITYQINHRKPTVHTVDFTPDFVDHLYFVHLNQKQDSKEGIQLYRSIEMEKTEFVNAVSGLTHQMLEVQNLSEFEQLLAAHERLVGSFLNITPLKEALFADYFGAIKSLGAWGGDFILVTGNEHTPGYFKDRGYETVLSYKEMILT